MDRPRNMARIGRDHSLGPNDDVDHTRISSDAVDSAFGSGGMLDMQSSFADAATHAAMIGRMDSDNSRSVSVPLEEDLDLIGFVDDDDYNSSERHEIDAFISAAILAEASSSRTKDKEHCKGPSSLKSTLSRDLMSQ